MFYLPLTGGCSAWLVSAAFPAQLTRIIGRWRSRATLRGSKPPAEWSFLRTNTPQVAATTGFFAAAKNPRRRRSAAVAARPGEGIGPVVGGGPRRHAPPPAVGGAGGPPLGGLGAASQEVGLGVDGGGDRGGQADTKRG